MKNKSGYILKQIQFHNVIQINLLHRDVKLNISRVSIFIKKKCEMEQHTVLYVPQPMFLYSNFGGFANKIEVR